MLCHAVPGGQRVPRQDEARADEEPRFAGARARRRDGDEDARRRSQGGADGGAAAQAAADGGRAQPRAAHAPRAPPHAAPGVRPHGRDQRGGGEHRRDRRGSPRARQVGVAQQIRGHAAQRAARGRRDGVRHALLCADEPHLPARPALRRGDRPDGGAAPTASTRTAPPPQSRALWPLLSLPTPPPSCCRRACACSRRRWSAQWACCARTTSSTPRTRSTAS